jgi:hypothetical protein
MKAQVSLRYSLLLPLLLFIMMLTCLANASNKDIDLEYWQNLTSNTWGKGSYKLYTLCECRFNKNLSTLYYFRIAENFAYQALPCLNLEAHYSFLSYKSRGASHFTYANRLELETNSLLQMVNGAKFIWRNRLELIKKQGVSHIQFVYRHRIICSVPHSKSQSIDVS